jgi:hypothetical protein
MTLVTIFNHSMFLKRSLLGLVTAAYLSVHHVMGKSAVRWDKLIHNPEAGFFVDMDGSKVLHIRVNQHFIRLYTVTKENFLYHAMGYSVDLKFLSAAAKLNHRTFTIILKCTFRSSYKAY